MHTIQKIIDSKVWTSFFNENGSPSFLQSWEYGEFQKRMGYEIYRLGIYEDKTLVGIALVVKIRAKRGNFLFIPHGPIIVEGSKKQEARKIILTVLDYLRKIAQKEKFSFIRIAPVWEDSKEGREVFQTLGFHTAPIYMHAERVWVLPLEKAEEELLREMRKTTRFSIRMAEKEGVTIEKYSITNNQLSINNQSPIINKNADFCHSREGGNPETKIENRIQNPIETFWKLYTHTAERESFTPFSKKYITAEYEEFSKAGNAVFLFANQSMSEGAYFNFPQAISDSQLRKINNDVPERKYNTLAGALVIFTRSTAFYHQGASIHSKVPAPYLLQWEAIKEAKKRGCKFYNFWGTYLPGRTPKAWEGLSLFKQGFGGRQIDYIPTQDYIINPLQYFISFLIDTYLKKKRGI